MSIRAIFPAGVTELTVHGLHQWDRGQQLEIEAVDLPAMVEVHFACSGMETAVVRSCADVGGSVTAAIPDHCLEQTTPVVAWVYAIGETSGETILTVKLPIVARTQPQPAPTVPEDVSDKYTEAVGAMNALVAESEQILQNAADEIEGHVAEKIQEGEWTARYAQHAEEADSADVANSASFANLLALNPVKPNITEGLGPISYRITTTGVYLVVLGAGNAIVTTVVCVEEIGKVAFGSSAMFGENTAAFTDKAYVMCDANGDLTAHYSGTLVSGAYGSLPIIAVYKIAGESGGSSSGSSSGGSSGSSSSGGGESGKDGVGISKIEKTSTNGLVDTYTITLTNGDTHTFTVTNGKDGVGGGGAGVVVVSDTSSAEDFYNAYQSHTKDGAPFAYEDGFEICFLIGAQDIGGEPKYYFLKPSTGEYIVVATNTDTGTVNISKKNVGSQTQGPQGDPGHTPVKGEDYFTEEDKAEMVSAVIAALPIYSGEVVDV